MCLSKGRSWKFLNRCFLRWKCPSRCGTTMRIDKHVEKKQSSSDLSLSSRGYKVSCTFPQVLCIHVQLPSVNGRANSAPLITTGG